MSKERIKPFLTACMVRKNNDKKDYIVIEAGDFGMDDYYLDFEPFVQFCKAENIMEPDTYCYGAYDPCVKGKDTHFYFAWSANGLKDFEADYREERKKCSAYYDNKLGKVW